MVLWRGLAAGAAATTALDAVTYGDMLIRGRPASEVPEQSVTSIAKRAHLPVGDDETAANRLHGAAALLGQITGIAIAVAHESLGTARLSVPVSSLLIGASAMTATNASVAAMGVSDPRRWTAAEWLSDAIPHLAYGVVAAALLSRLRRE